MASSTRASLTPRATSCSSTMRRRATPKAASSEGFIELPALHVGQRAEVGEVERERRDRDVARVHGVEVGALVGLPPRIMAADPVVRPPAGVLLLDQRV